MRLYIVIILVPLFCINIAIFNNFFKKQFSFNDTEPFFEDFIITDVSLTSNQREIRDSDESDEINSAVLHSLHTALKAQLSKIEESPRIIGKENAEPVNISDTEIQNSVQLAMAFRESGKNLKALKIIEHAAAIAPTNPDILTYYGEILETTQSDIILADQLYVRALIFCPDHTGALSNRKRTVNVVEQLDLYMLQNIDKKRDILRNIPNSDDIFQKFKKQAYYLHIYHTVSNTIF